MLKIIKKDLTKYSTIRTQSSTKYFAELNSTEDIKMAMDFKNKYKLKFKIIGNGSNILFSKNYYNNILFLKLGNGFKNIDFNDTYVEIGGSYSLIQAGRILINKGYGDFIFFNLIPATIGGAVIQNAGTGECEEIKDVCSSALVYDIEKNNSIRLSLKDLDFTYRSSIIKKHPNKYIVLSAKFKLENKLSNINQLVLNMKSRVKEKTDREPKGYCFGSTFMNSKMKAWQYIDSIYSKLEKDNRINFSSKHKNWIINNNYSGDEVKRLILSAQMLIKKRFGINLKEEVDIV